MRIRRMEVLTSRVVPLQGLFISLASSFSVIILSMQYVKPEENISYL